MDETEESEKRPFVLCELESLKHVLHPLKSTQRIKYTCFGLSQKLLVFGATSGSLYIFKREPCTFLHLLPSKDGCITKLAISPDEKIVAYATNKGVVNLLEHNVLQSSKAAARKLQISHEHAGCEVTAFQWNSDSTELYIGDTSGRVSLLCVSVFTDKILDAVQNVTHKIIDTSNQHFLLSCLLQPKNIFQTPSMQLMQLDSCIVQMDFSHGLLLISTLTRCYLSDTEKEQYKQVGQKLRDGEFGACFICKSEPQQVGPLAPPAPLSATPASNQFDLLGVNESLPMRIKCNMRVFCARPGSRLWEVNCDGSVISTHQFKEAIATTPPSKVVTPKGPIGDDDQQGGKGGFNFPKLNAIGEKFLLTYRQDGVYIFDPDNSVVVLWSNVYSNIVDAQVWEDTVYLWLKSGQMHALTFQPVEKCILKLYFRKEYPVCAQLCHKYLEHLIKIVPSARKLHFISDLADKLSDHSELRQNILPLTSEILKFLPSKQAKSQKLKSGIYRIGNVGADSDDEGKSFRILRSLSGGRAKKVSDRARSLSASPKRRPVNLAKEKDLPRNNSMQTLPANGMQNGGSNYLTYADVCHDSPFTIMSSPETIAALHDLTNVLSSKLKQKWMSLEGRMKAFSQEVPLLDVGKNTKARERRDTGGGDGLEILIPNGRTEVKHNGTEPRLDIDVSQVKESIQTGNHEQVLQSCLECFEKHNLKWALDSTKSFPFKSLFNPAELSEIKNALHNSFQSKFILGLLPAPSECKPDESYPEIFKSIHSDEDLSLDLSLSKLVTAFGEVLDEFTILQDIIHLGLPCYFGSWCSVLNFFQQDVLKFITSESKDDIREAIMHKSCPLPRLLNVMYLLLRVSSNEGIDICLSIGENVTLRDFCYVVLKLQQQKIAAGNASHNIQRYCQNILLSFLSKKNLGDDSWADMHVYRLALDAFVNLNLIQSQPNCQCGFPQPGTNRRFPLQFLSIGDLLLKHLRHSDEALYLATCRKLSLWKNVVAHKLENGAAVADVLSLVLQLDSVQIFDELLPKLEEQQFERALQITRALDETGNCLNCTVTLPRNEERVLNWTFVGQSAVKVFGPDRAIAIMDRNTEAAKVGLLKKSFFQTCILASLLSEEPTRVNKVVEIMQHKGEAKHLFDPEVGGRVMEALSKDLALQGVLPTQFMPPTTSKEHHWGVQVRLWDQKCPRCSLPFADNILLKEGGVRIFPCSHAFHVACLGDFPNHCLQCKVNSYEMQ